MPWTRYGGRNLAVKDLCGEYLTEIVRKGSLDVDHFHVIGSTRFVVLQTP